MQGIALVDVSRGVGFAMSVRMVSMEIFALSHVHLAVQVTVRKALEYVQVLVQMVSLVRNVTVYVLQIVI